MFTFVQESHHPRRPLDRSCARRAGRHVVLAANSATITPTTTPPSVVPLSVRFTPQIHGTLRLRAIVCGASQPGLLAEVGLCWNNAGKFRPRHMTLRVRQQIQASHPLAFTKLYLQDGSVVASCVTVPAYLPRQRGECANMHGLTSLKTTQPCCRSLCQKPAAVVIPHVLLRDSHQRGRFRVCQGT